VGKIGLEGINGNIGKVNWEKLSKKKLCMMVSIRGQFGARRSASTTREKYKRLYTRAALVELQLSSLCTSASRD
jgi:hypothetical protein